MQHLYSSVVKINKRELTPTASGSMIMKWVPVEGLQYMRCRLDLQFLRPGKDTPAAVVAGVIPDREGIMFCDTTDKLRAGMQVVTIDGSNGKQVVKGVFEIKEMPDVALDFDSAHHIEVKIIETVQKDSNFPDLPDSYAPSDPPVGP